MRQRGGRSEGTLKFGQQAILEYVGKGNIDMESNFTLAAEIIVLRFS